MDDPCRMQVFYPAEHLVEEVGHSFVVQVHVDDLAEVRVHQFHHEVDVGEGVEGLERKLLVLFLLGDFLVFSTFCGVKALSRPMIYS